MARGHRRLAGGLTLLAVLAGGSLPQVRAGGYMSQVWAKEAPDGCSNGIRQVQNVDTLVGPWGQPVPMSQPYTADPPNGEEAARSMLAQSVPLDLQMAYQAQAGKAAPPVFNPAIGMGVGMPMGGGMPPGMGGGMPPGMGGGMPPGMGMGMPPGMSMGMPMGGPSLSPTPGGYPVLPPGVNGMGFGMPGGQPGPGGLTQTAGNEFQLTAGMPPKDIILTGAPAGSRPPFGVARTEVRFAGPAGMKISWYSTQNDGKQGFGAQSLEAPGRYNFLQAAIYRLKLSDIPNRPGVELYPTLEVVPANSKTATFLAHSAVPVSFTEEDFDQVASGNFVVKVIYLPDPQFQDLASTGLAEVVSSQLEPGVDPIGEAQRRGSILLVVRTGNIDLEAPNTPAMDAPGPGGKPAFPQGQPLNMQPNLPNGMSRMVPYGMVGRPNGAGQQPVLPPGGPQSPFPMAQPNAMPLPGGQPQSNLPPVNPNYVPNNFPSGQPASRPTQPPGPFPPQFQGAPPGPAFGPAPQFPPSQNLPPISPAPRGTPIGQAPATPAVQQVGYQAPGTAAANAGSPASLRPANYTPTTAELAAGWR